MNEFEKQLWSELFRAEKSVDRIARRARDSLVGPDLAVTLGGRGREAVDTALLDRSVSN